MAGKRTILSLVLGLGLAPLLTSAFETPAFEVVAIKRSDTEGRRMFIISPGMHNGRLHGQMVTLKQLIATAWGITDARVFGPEAITANRFDIEAKAPEGTPDKLEGPMLQNMLRERFGLRVHTEKRTMPIYNLAVSRGGIKMPVWPAPPMPRDPSLIGAHQIAGSGTVEAIAKQLSYALQRPVFDKTGRTERFEYNLYYTPVSADGVANAEIGPTDIFTAIQQQLGLKLEAAKGEVEVVVVDSVNPLPTEN